MFISNNNVYISLLSAVCLLKIWSRDSNSGKGYGIYLFFETHRTALRSIQPSIQRLPGAKWPGIRAEHSSSSSVELKMSGTLLPLRPTRLHSMHGHIFTLFLQIYCYFIVLLLTVYLCLCQHGIPSAMDIRMCHSSRLADRLVLGTSGKMTE